MISQTAECALRRRMDNVMAAAEKALEQTTLGEVLDEPGLFCSLPVTVHRDRRGRVG